MFNMDFVSLLIIFAAGLVAGSFGTLMAAAVFAINGAIVYPLAASLFAGMFIGSYFGRTTRTE